MFTEFNVAAKMPGSRMRRLDGIRFPEPLGGLTGAFVSGSENRTLVEEMFRRCTVELIEVHRWGFYALGQVVGKRRLLEGHWAPKEIHSVLIVDNSKSPQYRPSEDPDPAAEWVFRDFGIRVVVL